MGDVLGSIRAKPFRIVIGLNSGTSMDGIDALLVRIHGSGAEAKLEPVRFEKLPMPPAIRARLLPAPDLGCEELCRLNRDLGVLFADAARRVARAARVRIGDVDIVASHGQTVCHLPAKGATSTLQIADLDVIAAELGLLVIGDFRAADVANGGAGAPLMPYLDRVVFREHPGTVALNLGGITSLTFVPDDGKDPVAFDVGPANVVLDLLAARASGGKKTADLGGELAKSGRVRADIVDAVLAHPFVARRPPKTSGREEFGGAYVERLLSTYAAVPIKDILASHTAAIGRSVGDAIRRFVPGGLAATRQVVASGGGIHNRTLMDGLRDAVKPIRIRTLASSGIDPEAKEALLFALLGNDRVFGLPTNVPSVTGARRAVPLGKIAGGGEPRSGRRPR